MRCEVCGASAWHTEYDKLPFILCREHFAKFKISSKCEKTVRLNDYGYKPEPVFHGENEPTIGFELEVEIGNGRAYNDFISDMLLKSTDEFLYCKYDSTIHDGVEIVSHPFDEEWYWENIFKFDWLTNNTILGLKSANNCGMHVHISNRTITRQNINDLFNFFVENREFLSKYSGRRDNSIAEWSRFPARNTKHRYLNSFSERGGKCSQLSLGRGALNISPRDTIEIRLFGSTMENLKFHANLQMCFSLIKFVKKLPNNTNIKEYYYFVREEKYEHLAEVLHKMLIRKV